MTPNQNMLLSAEDNLHEVLMQLEAIILPATLLFHWLV